MGQEVELVLLAKHRWRQVMFKEWLIENGKVEGSKDTWIQNDFFTSLGRSNKFKINMIFLWGHAHTNRAAFLSL